MVVPPSSCAPPCNLAILVASTWAKHTSRTGESRGRRCHQSFGWSTIWCGAAAHPRRRLLRAGPTWRAHGGRSARRGRRARRRGFSTGLGVDRPHPDRDGQTPTAAKSTSSWKRSDRARALALLVYSARESVAHRDDGRGDYSSIGAPRPPMCSGAIAVGRPLVGKKQITRRRPREPASQPKLRCTGVESMLQTPPFGRGHVDPDPQTTVDAR